MWVWVLGWSRRIPSIQRKRTDGSFPFCSTEPRVFYAGGDRQASAVWGISFQVIRWALFSGLPITLSTRWSPEFLMCSDPSCHCSIFSTRLRVYPKSRGERETLGAGNVEVGVASCVMENLHRRLSSDTHGQLSVFGDSWEFSGLIGILEFPRSNSKQ